MTMDTVNTDQLLHWIAHTKEDLIIYLSPSSRSQRLASPTGLDSCHRGSAGEIWSIFYKPSTSIYIFPKKIKSPHDDRNPLVGE